MEESCRSSCRQAREWQREGLDSEVGPGADDNEHFGPHAVDSMAYLVTDLAVGRIL